MPSSKVPKRKLTTAAAEALKPPMKRPTRSSARVQTTLPAIVPPAATGMSSTIENTDPRPVIKKEEEVTPKLEDAVPRLKLEEDHGETPEEDKSFIDRDFYPLEMSNARADQYRNGGLPKPIDELYSALEATASGRKTLKTPGKTVLHWFRQDFRLLDNTALYLAAQKARSKPDTNIIAFYLVSPEEYEAHVRSPARIDFIFRTLKVLKDDLDKLDIPLYIETVDRRKNIAAKVIELAEKWDAKHIFANMEYEVDELRRDARIVRRAAGKGIDFSVVHDSCIVPPGRLSTKTGARQFAVYTPWYRAWIEHLGENPELLEFYPPPSRNPPTAREFYSDIFSTQVPDPPKTKTLPEAKAVYLHSIWPAGEKAALERLDVYLKEKIAQYADNRDFPGGHGTSVLSVHFAAGTLSARYAVCKAKEMNKPKSITTGSKGIVVWVKEVAWRDFYKHVLVAFPYVCMNKPFKPEYSNIKWSYNDVHFSAWCNGQTGYPIIDAAMRQLNTMCYMHNRTRMIVASFLAKDLCLDWRKGERYFMLNLIDGDFASNNGGWGWSSSTGVDPQPYFRIFNPLLQSEKFDADGEYIRKWVPELSWVRDNNAIHVPYERLSSSDMRKLEKMGYPRPIVKHSEAKEKALKMYKDGLGRDKP